MGGIENANIKMENDNVKLENKSKKRYWLRGGIISIGYTLVVVSVILLADNYFFPPKVLNPNFTIGSIISVLLIPVYFFVDPLRLDELYRKGYLPEPAAILISALITGVIIGRLYGKFKSRPQKVSV